MEENRMTGRVTIPTDLDVVPETLEILKKWGADAIRDCDGTDFPQELAPRYKLYGQAGANPRPQSDGCAFHPWQ